VFSPSDKLLASAAEDGKLLLWNPLTGLQVDALQGQEGSVRCLAFSSNGQSLAGGTAGGAVLLWLVASRRLKQAQALAGGAVNVVQFDITNMNRVYAGTEDGQVRLALEPGKAGG
jgi:WD40 repeat protein